MKNTKFRVVAFLAIFILVSCKNDEEPGKNEGSVNFSFTQAEASSGRNKGADVRALLITVKASDGSVVYEKKQINLFKLGGEYISEPLSFRPGSFKLTEFLLLDENNKVLYATPVEGSKLAHLVADPLPINFSIVKDKTIKVTPQVIAVNEDNAGDFGYSTFSFNIVKTFDFLISVFAFNEASNNFELTASHLKISSAGNILFDQDISDSTNSVKTKDDLTNYSIEITKSGYTTYQHVFTADELRQHANDPIIVTLFSGVDLSNGLVAYYPFSNNANDQSPNGLHGSVYEATLTMDRHNNPNAAYYFDGINDYIEVANNALLNFDNDFTLVAWVNMAQAKQMGSRIIDKSVGSTNYGFLLDTYAADQMGDGIRLFCGDAWRYKSNSKIVASQWTLIVGTYKDGVGKIYINGVLDSENTSSTITKIITSSTPMRFGFDTGVRTGPDFDDSFKGKLDDIRIYHRTLSLSEIKYLYQN
jgi:hypothetical protein